MGPINRAGNEGTSVLCMVHNVDLDHRTRNQDPDQHGRCTAKKNK